MFNMALVQPTEEQRASYLTEACGNDQELRKRIENLLEAHGRAGHFLGGSEPASHAPVIAELPGTEIGLYKLLEQIGEGGMGTVYMAQQTKPVRRKVALKVIKPGMDTRQVVARFAAEQQALAMMEHPHIARVYDAGVTGPESRCPGRPYRYPQRRLRPGSLAVRAFDRRHTLRRATAPPGRVRGNAADYS
jgi:hypothetical protein